MADHTSPATKDKVRTKEFIMRRHRGRVLSSSGGGHRGFEAVPIHPADLLYRFELGPPGSQRSLQCRVQHDIRSEKTEKFCPGPDAHSVGLPQPAAHRHV